MTCVEAEREGRLDRLADHVRSAIAMKFVYECLGVARR
jgi:hypothetical protein